MRLEVNQPINDLETVRNTSLRTVLYGPCSLSRFSLNHCCLFGQNGFSRIPHVTYTGSARAIGYTYPQHMVGRPGLSDIRKKHCRGLHVTEKDAEMPIT